MPYVSDTQRRFFHTETAKEQGITPAVVKEYDQANKGLDLPEKASKRTLKKRKKRLVKLEDKKG